MDILIIEDDPAVGTVLQKSLEKEGYHVGWHTRGDVGLAAAREQHPQLIILDLRLPDGSGLDVCRRLRRLGLRQPVLMLTVQGEEIDKVLGLEAGADDYLTKPYSLRELLARVRALLRRAYGELSTAEADLIYAADLVIDRTRGEVRRGREVLNLTPTELRLLTYLARHPGQALSREQILAAVWGQDAVAIDENTVMVHVRRLRLKIEPNPDRPVLILTVPGIGYRFAG